jgi:hypothetical protein
MPRIGFSSGSDHVTSSASTGRIAQVSTSKSIGLNSRFLGVFHLISQKIETDPDDASFWFRITWSRGPGSTGTQTATKTTNGCDDSERYS